MLVLFTLLTGLAYPLAITGIAQAASCHRAGQRQPDLAQRRGRRLGADRPDLRVRPLFPAAPVGDQRARSETLQDGDAPYNAGNSSGSNLGPTSQEADRPRRRATSTSCAKRALEPIPADAVTTSASGLDPAHLPGLCRAAGRPRRHGAQSSAGVACARWSTARTEGRFLGLIGEPRVNVLLLNLALDALASRPDRRDKHGRRRATARHEAVAGRAARACRAGRPRQAQGISRRGARRRQDLRHAVRGAPAPRRDGIDVVVGLVETHGRAETRGLLDGLEVLPRRPSRLSRADADGVRPRRGARARKPEAASRRRIRPHQCARTAAIPSATRTSRNCSTPASTSGRR